MFAARDRPPCSAGRVPATGDVGDRRRDRCRVHEPMRVSPRRGGFTRRRSCRLRPDMPREDDGKTRRADAHAHQADNLIKHRAHDQLATRREARPSDEKPVRPEPDSREEHCCPQSPCGVVLRCRSSRLHDISIRPVGHPAKGRKT